MDTVDTSADCVIKEDNHVLLKKANLTKLVQIKRKREIWWSKNKFYLDGAIGHPFGTTFEVKDGQMVKITKTVTQDVECSSKGIDQDKDNRHLHDLDSNQKLTADEIDKMKRDGVTGEKLIEQLIENSATFQGKTEYAQEKWVKKKKKKHILEVTVLKPTSRLLCELYWSKGPYKISNLRIDTLGQILTCGNVRAHSTVAVVDTCLCLVTGAVLERLGGFGKVVSFYSGGSPMRTPLDAYDFPPEVKDTLYHFPLELVNSIQTYKSGEAITERGAGIEEETIKSKCEDIEDKTDVTLEKNNDEDDKHSDTNSIENKEETVEGENTEVGDTEKSEEVTQENQNETNSKGSEQNKGRKRKRFKDRDLAREDRRKEIERARRVLSNGNIDCLIVACKYHPTPIVTALVDLLAPSRQVVVFSQFKEALQDCYVYLREHGGLVSYRLTETWHRHYQNRIRVCDSLNPDETLSNLVSHLDPSKLWAEVLPNRTHPVIQMAGTGGYLLTATTIMKPQS